MSGTAHSPKPELKYQALADLSGLPRSALYSHYRRKVDDLADDTNFPRLSAFLPWNLGAWIKSYLKFAFRRKHPFVCYPSTGEQGVYPLRAADGGLELRLAIAGDWSTGTKESEQVAQGMCEFVPDYTIHLGDVYYVGACQEVEENCLGKTEFGYQGISWPKGKVGSFTMNGNHEMYANGDGYFDLFTPNLGIPGSKDRKQLASFFCLENDIWRILALDTGYNSTGLPILGFIPLINRIPGIGPTCRLEAVSIDWLRNVVRPKERPRATILLTHHQAFSSFESVFKLPAQQLTDFIAGQDILWIWGHEHRWSVYDKAIAAGLRAYGRCAGHGGMPVEMGKPKHSAQAPLQFFDERVYEVDGNEKVGFNGFVNLTIQGNVATLDHRDVHNHSILKETFTVEEGHNLRHTFLYVDPKLSRGIAAPNPALARL
jgi:Calcineurin-like phosphoesterase